MKTKKISLLDKILVTLFPYIPNKPEVREYLDKEATKLFDKQTSIGLITTSNAISKVKFSVRDTLFLK